jgi:hypothetical protein
MRIVSCGFVEGLTYEFRKAIFMKTPIKLLLLVLLFPCAGVAQMKDDWPPLSYLRSDFKSVTVVAHVRIREAKIVDQIPGYDNWRILAEVVEPFKGRLSRGDVIEYFHGAEAPSKKEFFAGEKIVFLLAERDREKQAWRYSVLENSTLPYTIERVKRLRIIRRTQSRRPAHRA